MFFCPGAGVKFFFFTVCAVVVFFFFFCGQILSFAGRCRGSCFFFFFRTNLDDGGGGPGRLFFFFFWALFPKNGRGSVWESGLILVGAVTLKKKKTFIVHDLYSNVMLPV